MHKRKRASEEEPDLGPQSSSSSNPPPPKRHHPEPTPPTPTHVPADPAPPSPTSGSPCGLAIPAPPAAPANAAPQVPAFTRTTRSMVPPMVFPGPPSSLPTYPPPSFYPFQQQQQQQAPQPSVIPPTNPPSASAVPSMADMHQAAMASAAQAPGNWMGAAAASSGVPTIGYPVPVPLPFAYPFAAMPFRFVYPFPSMFPLFHDHAAAAASMSFPPMFGGFPPGMTFGSGSPFMNPNFSGFQRMTFRADFPFQVDESIPNGNSFYLNVLQRLENDDVAGATPDQIEDLPTRKFTAEEKSQKDSEATGRLHQQKCAICLEDFEEGTDVKSLPCFHIFHPACIDKWLPLNKSCPVCRVDIDTEINFEEEGSQTEAAGQHQS